MKKYILMTIASMMLVSCVDTIILPDDKTVDEDFWQTKEDVASMVNAAYAAVNSEDVFTRLIIWGEYRSDELVQTTNPTGTIPDALAEITSVNIQTTNMYATWAAFYNIINRCNIVLDRAAGVMEVDPNYTEGDYNADRSQMLALRSLCYFYLVRAFRDVPYVSKSYMESSQNMALSQSSPEEVLQHCIDDLIQAKTGALSAKGYTVRNWQRVGFITADAINAILADIYLWRASVKHSAADYQACIDACDELIASKQSQHIVSSSELTTKLYPLADATAFFRDVFVSQNAEESIFEVQSTNNAGLCKYLYKYANNNSAEGFLMPGTIFSKQSASMQNLNGNVFGQKDLRYYGSCYFKGSDVQSVRKMVAQNGVNSEATQERDANRTFANFDQNFIFYRLSDVMLMRAEALVQLGSTAGDDYMRKAFNMVQAVHARALLDPATDSLKWSTFSGKSQSEMEQLVMEERQRELCFEGKRWFDLLRFNYRHVEGVEYNKILADIIDANGNSTATANYGNMLDLMVRSEGINGSSIKAKMRNEAYLYWPIPDADVNVCATLKQNPVYKKNNDFEKTY
ncbi:MAG: RagB/SusD family nutrient uptake outer membrane protein [Prevotella sp.]|nr:RagB/SusD family nutrient uptake outer membrane protein [Prevotella sp.]